MDARSIASLVKQSTAGGLCFHVRHNDHVGLMSLLAERRLQADGLIFDARYHQRHKVLRQESNRAGITTFLDTQAMELAMPGASSKGHASLPWALARPHCPKDFTTEYSAKVVRGIAACVGDGEYLSLMGPTHYLADDSSEWMEIDRELIVELRTKLQAERLGRTQIIYPLALHSRLFYDESFRAVLKAMLKEIPIDAIALRIHPFGTNAGPHAMRSYIEACRDLARLGIPLMVERAGFSGLIAYALGVVSYLESGIVMGDSFDVGGMQRPPKAKPTSYSPPQRIYIEALGTSIELSVATELLNSSHGKLRFACKDQSCCPNGFTNMLNDPHRHSTLARQRQYAALARVPPSLRADHFIANILSPICDMLSRGADVHEPLKKAHRRMLSVKETVMDLHREQERSRQRPVPPASRTHLTGQVVKLIPRDFRGR